MGSFWSSIAGFFSSFGGGVPRRILMVGLDAAGKTTIVFKLKLNEFIHTIPTVGFNIEEVKIGTLTMAIWDFPGQFNLRALWHHYYAGTHGVVFVIDSCDNQRLLEAKALLDSMLQNDKLKKAAFLVLCNKQDESDAMSTGDILQILNLQEITDRPWHIQATVATTGEGIEEGFQWLSNQVKYITPSI